MPWGVYDRKKAKFNNGWFKKGHKSFIKKGFHLTKEHKEKLSKARMGKTPWNKKKDGRILSNGYILIHIPNHPFAHTKRVLEHRLIIEKYIGRYLRPKEATHHINRIKDDNRIENLMLFVNNPTHMRFHKNPNNVKLEEIIFDGRKLNHKSVSLK